jgi:energy-coupling factor transporter ATP-binding protein EcfA2
MVQVGERLPGDRGVRGPRERRGRDRSLARIPDRVAALSRFVALAGPYLASSTVEHAGGVVERAGTRLSLSGSHTIVALAGTTGSGKSSLFNALAGTPLSPAGLRRPTTGIAHAAVFTDESGAAHGDADRVLVPTDEDAAALLDWLGIGVRFTAVSDAALDGLVLLDLPDIDSVERGHGIEADRLLELVDLVVWVLDPQKYADLTVHKRYRDTFRHHGDITVVALNQADRLSTADLRLCLDDLAHILGEDGLDGVPVVPTSTVDSPGADDLREVLARAVEARASFLRRVAADVDAAVERLGSVMAAQPAELDHAGAPLVETLCAAAGVPSIARAVRDSYVYRAVRHTGWPVTRWLRRLRGDPLRRIGLAGPRPRPGAAVGAPAVPPASPAARARVTLATRALGDTAGHGLRPPWPQVMLDAARERADDVPDALDVAVVRTDLGQARARAWWRAIGLGQLLLLGAALAGLAWLVVRWVLFALAIPTPAQAAVGRLPWPTVLLVGGLLAGLVLGAVARVAVTMAARRHGARAARRLTRSVAAVADGLVLSPVVRVRDDYRAARDALAEATRR